MTEAAQVNRLGRRCVASLIALTGFTALLVGLDAFGMVTFIIAFAMFSLPLPAALAVSATGLAVASLTSLTIGMLGENMVLAADHLDGWRGDGRHPSTGPARHGTS